VIDLRKRLREERGRNDPKKVGRQPTGRLKLLKMWYARRDSNARPLAPEARTLEFHNLLSFSKLLISQELWIC